MMTTAPFDDDDGMSSDETCELTQPKIDLTVSLGTVLLNRLSQRPHLWHSMKQGASLLEAEQVSFYRRLSSFIIAA